MRYDKRSIAISVPTAMAVRIEDIAKRASELTGIKISRSDVLATIVEHGFAHAKRIYLDESVT